MSDVLEGINKWYIRKCLDLDFRTSWFLTSTAFKFSSYWEKKNVFSTLPSRKLNIEMFQLAFRLEKRHIDNDLFKFAPCKVSKETDELLSSFLTPLARKISSVIKVATCPKILFFKHAFLLSKCSLELIKMTVIKRRSTLALWTDSNMWSQVVILQYLPWLGRRNNFLK